MVYIDTSALVPMFIREAKSDSLVDWLESSAERLVLSELCLVEFASAAAIKLRSGQASKNMLKQATARLHEFAATHCTVAVPSREEFRSAAELLADEKLKLRTGDALHLAVARNLSVRALLCLDQEMIASARSLAIDVVSV